MGFSCFILWGIAQGFTSCKGRCVFFCMMPSCLQYRRCSGERKRDLHDNRNKGHQAKCKTCCGCSSCLLDFMRDIHAETWKGFLLASLLFLLSCLQSLFHHHYMFHCFTVGMRLKTAIMGLVYRKVNACPPFPVAALRIQVLPVLAWL